MIFATFTAEIPARSALGTSTLIITMVRSSLDCFNLTSGPTEHILSLVKDKDSQQQAASCFGEFSKALGELIEPLGALRNAYFQEKLLIQLRYYNKEFPVSLYCRCSILLRHMKTIERNG